MSYGYIEDNALETLSYKSFMLPVERAGNFLSRLDERLLRSPQIADGFVSRNHYLETCANMWADGELVHLKDLVLHDVEADISPPTHELTRAARLLFLRRKFSNLDLKFTLSRSGLFNLINRNDHNESDEFEEVDDRTLDGSDETAHKEQKLLDEIDAINQRSQNIVEQVKAGQKIQRKKPRGDEYNENNGISVDPLNQWLELVNYTKAYPAVLGAAILLDAWLILKPLENSNALGRILTAHILHQRLTKTVLPPIIMGLQKSRRRWQAYDPLETRLNVILAGFETAGKEAMGELDRLALARERMMLVTKNCRSNSSLPDLIDLFIQMPLVSTATASKALKVTPRAVDQLLKQLGAAVPRERTGRGRYRMWGII